MKETSYKELAASVSHPAYDKYEKYLHEMLDKHLRILETAPDAETMYRTQGSVRCLRQLLNLKENVLADLKREK
jgi:hypothetical protein|tara:strand:+ start:649 stop:870 length:222 start_codon:yes stop_codon:yes gene_type:complete